MIKKILFLFFVSSLAQAYPIFQSVATMVAYPSPIPGTQCLISTPVPGQSQSWVAGNSGWNNINVNGGTVTVSPTVTNTATITATNTVTNTATKTTTNTVTNTATTTSTNTPTMTPVLVPGPFSYQNGVFSLSPTPTIPSGITLMAPVITVITSGSGSVTAPSGALYAELLCIAGAGGSQAGQGNGSLPASGAGGPTSFGNLAWAPGGQACPANGGNFGTPTPAVVGGNLYGYITGNSIAGGSGQFNNSTSVVSCGGAPGIPSILGGSGGMSGGDAVPNTGSSGGGGGQSFNQSGISGFSGGPGGYVKGYFIPTPNATYVYSVGSAGVTSANSSPGGAAGKSAGGLNWIKWFFN